MSRISPSLPSRYHVMPASVELRIPGFASEWREGISTFAPEAVDCGAWFNGFVDRVVQAVGREFLPICRLSDGEFEFLLGPQPLGSVWPWHARLAWHIKRWLSRVRPGGFRAGGRVRGQLLYSSGRYSDVEWRQAVQAYGDNLAAIADTGFLAVHLTYGTAPFQQHFFPAFREWLVTKPVELSLRNYVPFYFVYALLRGPRRREVYAGRRIAVINSAVGEKRRRIIDSLKAEGARSVAWVEISAERSLFDRISLAGIEGQVDLCLVAAGVGKTNILVQLRPLGVPCVDAGFVLEALADPDKAGNRPYLVGDREAPHGDKTPYIQ